jgi:hypothetical protein
MIFLKIASEQFQKGVEGGRIIVALPGDGIVEPGKSAGQWMKGHIAVELALGCGGKEGNA